MAHTKLLARGNPADVAPDQSELAQLDLASYRAIRLSVGNWADSPAPVIISVSHVDKPNTPNANLITSLGSFPLAPRRIGQQGIRGAGRDRRVRGQPEQPPVSGIQVFFTIYDRTD